jgi:hypothetical protein
MAPIKRPLSKERTAPCNCFLAKVAPRAKPGFFALSASCLPLPLPYLRRFGASLAAPGTHRYQDALNAPLSTPSASADQNIASTIPRPREVQSSWFYPPLSDEGPDHKPSSMIMSQAPLRPMKAAMVLLIFMESRNPPTLSLIFKCLTIIYLEGDKFPIAAAFPSPSHCNRNYSTVVSFDPDIFSGLLFYCPSMRGDRRIVLFNVRAFAAKFR